METLTESRFDILSNLLPGVFLTLAANGEVVQANTAARTVLGFDPAELIGRPVSQLVHPDDVKVVADLLSQSPQPAIVRQLDLRLRTRVGGHRLFRWTVTWTDGGELYVVTEDLSRSLVADAVVGTDPVRVLVDTLDDYSIFLLDESGYVTTWNAGAKSITGYDAADVIGQHFAIFFSQEAKDQDLPRRELEEAARAGYFEAEGWRVRKDGSRFWALSVLSVLRDANGRLLGFGKVTRDMTARKLAEENLRQSEERLRMLVDAASEYAIFMLDPVGRVLTWNAGAQRIKGYTPEEIIGQHFSRFYTPEDIATRKPARAIATARETGKFQDEGWRLRKDGTRFWASVVLSRLVNSAGELVGFGKVTRDLTDRRRAEEELRQSEERFRLLVDTVEDYAIFLLDPEGRVQSWNRGAERIKGYRADEIVGEHFSRFYTPEDIASQKPIRKLEIAAVEGRVEDEGWRVRKDGTRFWANVVVTRLVDEHHRLIGFAKVTRDLTKRREMDEAIRAANHDLEKRVAERTAELDAALKKQRELEQQLIEAAKLEAVGRLAGGVAHDFNNMLTVIQGNLEILKERNRQLPEEDLETIEEIEYASSRSTELTRQLLAFSRRQILMPRDVNLNDLVRNVLPMLKRLIGEHIHVSTVLAPNLMAVHADPSQIEQVIVNLVVNARDALSRGGSLTIETLNATLDDSYATTHAQVEPGSYAMLSISDTGTGMDEATRRRVFEPFFTTKAVGKGTGLGLATVHGIVRQSGGHVQVYSELGHGTTFKVYLPTIAVKPEECAAPGSGPAHAGGCGPISTILLVEDEAPVRRLARSILKNAGHHVIDAANGEVALEIVQNTSERIDLLVSDVVMPGMSGVQLHQKLIAIRPELPVLYMSGYTENAVVHQGVLDPDIHFLQKPFTGERLCGKVRELLQSKSGDQKSH